MKKLHYAFLLIVLSLVSTHSFGQMAIGKGTSFINAGIGVGGYGYFNGSGVALTAGYETGVYENITVGGVAGFRTYGSGVTSFDIGARGSYHFNELIKLTDDKLDLYAGIGVSFYRLSYGDSYIRSLGISDSYSTAYVPIHIGARYLFANNLGGFAEISSSLATLRLGLTFKLK
ncbi:hypothetical protein [Spirosoma rhododendri]|uniref:Outer membrane protein beta-barrel domain-containing protein n=1 Tax=Spirosoma rhododendri TaxID=2728024 RepID=A0A7L5DK88_9BACT|nr:hypothetical protein [Spirosoma rhododendri]QJD77902.1 hypothetical protein HH216_05275 [Spirosoma rhododendri]